MFPHTAWEAHFNIWKSFLRIDHIGKGANFNFLSGWAIVKSPPKAKDFELLGASRQAPGQSSLQSHTAAVGAVDDTSVAVVYLPMFLQPPWQRGQPQGSNSGPSACKAELFH